MAIPNGFAHPMLSLGVITSLGLLKPDNLGDYIKLYEDMHLNSQVYDDFNVAYLISEASS